VYILIYPVYIQFSNMWSTHNKLWKSVFRFSCSDVIFIHGGCELTEGYFKSRRKFHDNQQRDIASQSWIFQGRPWKGNLNVKENTTHFGQGIQDRTCLLNTVTQLRPIRFRSLVSALHIFTYNGSLLHSNMFYW
jgi:hypothetical protein